MQGEEGMSEPLYKPIQSLENGAWYAARRIPGTETYSAEVECTSELAAQKACEALNNLARKAESK